MLKPFLMCAGAYLLPAHTASSPADTEAKSSCRRTEVPGYKKHTQLLERPNEEVLQDKACREE